MLNRRTNCIINEFVELGARQIISILRVSDNSVTTFSFGMKRSVFTKTESNEVLPLVYSRTLPGFSTERGYDSDKNNCMKPVIIRTDILNNASVSHGW